MRTPFFAKKLGVLNVDNAQYTLNPVIRIERKMFRTSEGVRGSWSWFWSWSFGFVGSLVEEEVLVEESVGVDVVNIGAGLGLGLNPSPGFGGERRLLYVSVWRAARSFAFWARYSGLCII